MPYHTTQDASRHVQHYHPGAYDFERFLDAHGVKAGWTFRVPGRDFGWMLNAGDICTVVYPYRWWAEDVAHEWINGRDLGTG
jgi:hypothetical protein